MRPHPALLTLLTSLIGCAEASPRPSPAADETTPPSAQAEAEDASGETAERVAIAPADPRRPGDPGRPARDPTLPECYSPANMESRFLFNPQIGGCACQEVEEAPEGLCLKDNIAMVCAHGRWLAGLDGPCLPRGFGRVFADAAADAGGGCFSPSVNTQRTDLPGCACEQTITNWEGFCVESQPLVCYQGAWRRVSSGPSPCLAPNLIDEATCRARGGEALAPKRDLPYQIWLKERLCPEGQELVGAITRVELDAGAEAKFLGQAPCCARP